MGEIVAFQPPKGVKRVQSVTPGSEAQILFFTGVRYVNAAEPGQSNTPPQGGGITARGRKRRRAR
ncbi:MAG: hypothetical protein NVSMB26_08320 [Beijerinckiaceae bacterium]